jgi:hypothetical protein
MKSSNLASLPSTENAALGGLPRRRPLKSKRGIQAISELRQLDPPVDLMPGTEATFLLQGELTKSKCSQWLHIAKQFYVIPRPPAKLSEPLPLRNLPPISFLDLLIDWIDAYAKSTGRKRTKGLAWRWNALRGFVKRNRPLQTRNFLPNVTRLARSIADHFSKAPFDSQILVLWGDWHRSGYSAKTRSTPSASRPADLVERGRLADRLFAVLKRFRNDGKISAEDCAALVPFVSDNFRRLIEALHDETQHQSFSELIAYAAAMDVYIQHLLLMNRVASVRDYVDDVTHWARRLGDPSVLSEFQVIWWRFCGHPGVEFRRRQKKRTRFPRLE